MLYRTIVNETPVTIYAGRTKSNWDVQIFAGSKVVFSDSIPLDILFQENKASQFCSTQQIYEAWEQFLESRTDNIGAITASVTSVTSYNHQFSMDIYFGDDVFRCDKDRFINPKPFLIWYIGTRHRIPKIEETEWQEFVSSMLSMAEQKHQDPLVPDLLSILITSMRAGQLHSDFCDTLAQNTLAKGDAVWFVYRRNEDYTLYIPSHVMETIRTRTNMTKEPFRSYWIPYLVELGDNRRRLVTTIKFEKRPRIRFWAMNMQKIGEVDDGIMDAIENMIDCEEENEIKEDERREKRNVAAE